MMRQGLLALILVGSSIVGCGQANTETVPTSDSESPAAAAPSSPATTEAPLPAAPEVSTPEVSTPEVSTPEVTPEQPLERLGTFVSAEHPTRGTARLVSGPDGTVLAFDGDFQTNNGPDLVVVLHRSSDVVGSTIPPAYPLQEGDYVAIAPLTSNQGIQQYAIPDTIDLAAYQSVAIWCRQFNATFGAAALPLPE